MQSKDLIKFLVKVLDENRNELVWEHVCYAPRELYLTYLKRFGLERFEMADALSKWAKTDFNVDIPVTTEKDIRIIKELIYDKYRNIYPNIARISNTDHQGWVRVWVSYHMERDLKHT